MITLHPPRTAGATRRRASLLWGASIATLVTAAAVSGARAQSMSALYAASHQAAAITSAIANPPPAGSNGASALGMAAASARALRYQTQVNSARDLAQQAQAAAQAAARALNQNQAAGIIDGLGAGGLQPVGNPVTAANDPTGLNTWQGAGQPTASPTNANQVTVAQTDPRAVLSWTTFNVGQHTTLTFDQKGNASWVALNRVVGQLDPTTGLRNPNLAPSPSQILGAIKADGTVLVINQNGIIFGPTSQVNANAMIASSLEIGRAYDVTQGASKLPFTIAQRDAEFLTFGLLGYSESSGAGSPTFSAQDVALPNGASGAPIEESNPEGPVVVQAGATLTSADTGYLMLLGPRVTNAGQLTSPDGEVALQSGRSVLLTASNGDANSVDPDVRGLVVSGAALPTDPIGYVNNSGIISAPRGYVSLGAPLNQTVATSLLDENGDPIGTAHTTAQGGAVIDSGVILSTTSVSRNGYVNIFGGDIQIAPGAVISIGPDADPTTIPQDSTSLGQFKPSRVRIGDSGGLAAAAAIAAGGSGASATGSRIDIGADSLIYAPSANITIGAIPGASNPSDGLLYPNASRLFIDSGATISAAGLTDVVIPASRNSIKIDPVKKNELRDSAYFRTGFLNGATVYVDPRLSGVRADGVAWVGSPLIEAGSYAQQVGVSVSELMTAGGNVTLGALSYSGLNAAQEALNALAGFAPTVPPDVIIKPDATIDIAGGWKTYQAGMVTQSSLVTASGQVVPISQANPDDTYVGVYSGYTVTQPRWGVTQSYIDPLLSGAHYEAQYSQGADAGSLTIKASAIVADGAVYAASYAGPQQILTAQAGTASGAVYGDARHLQAAGSQLPAGGYLNIQALDSVDSFGGGDISVTGAADHAPLAAEVASLAYGQSPTNPDGSPALDTDGSLATIAPRPAAALLPTDRLEVISLDADALSAMGLSQLSLSTSGRITLSRNAAVSLAPGGVFTALAGNASTAPGATSAGAIVIDGSITAPGGAISLSTGVFGGSVFAAANPLTVGDFDVVVNGTLSTAGRWANDFNASADQFVGAAYLGGGAITLTAAPRVTRDAQVQAVTCDPTMSACPMSTIDVSGSLRVGDAALLDLSGGGYVSPIGALTLTAEGGSLSLFEDTTYFQTNAPNAHIAGGSLSGFRVSDTSANANPNVILNPDQITAKIDLAGAIQAHGFGGGGTFTLAASSFDFGQSSGLTSGAALPTDFFSKTGFATYNITAYKTDLIANTLDSTLGGTNAVLTTDVATLKAGDTLNLNQSYYSPLLTSAQVTGLKSATTGKALYTLTDPTNGQPLLSADTQIASYDQKPVSLTLGGLIELHVQAGASVSAGAAGSSLTVGQLYSEGTIRLPSGAITQSELLPSFYTTSNAVAVSGTVGQFSGTEAIGQVTATQAIATPIYELGDLAPGVGVLLAAGSTVDVSGETLVNPRAIATGGVPQADFTDGSVVAGGSVTTSSANAAALPLFQKSYGLSTYNLQGTPAGAVGVGGALNAAGATILLNGASASFDRPLASAADGASTLGGVTPPTYGLTPVWSDAGSLYLGGGGTLTGATLSARGGAPQAQGGTLTVLDPVLYATDPATPIANAVATDKVQSAGFSSFIAQGSLSSAAGAVTLTVDRQIFVEARPLSGSDSVSSQTFEDSNAPLIGSGGELTLNAPYIALNGDFQTVSTPFPSAKSRPGFGVAANNSLTLNATGSIDVTGAVLFDTSVANATLNAGQAVRLTGVEPYQKVFNLNPGSVASSLIGQLAVNGDLTINAGQVYPTTGSAFTLSSSLAPVVAKGVVTAPGGTIRFGAMGATPVTPYSAGGSLIVEASNIDQAGVVRVPLGTLTLGLNSAAAAGFAPATTTVTLEPNSVTSVSADGLSIPYGTTTDQAEWFFAPTNDSVLTAPPKGVLQLAGGEVTVASGATVDLAGGGDVYAYEFASGTGGSRDVLDRFNTDQFSATNGLQYPDGRQVYAIAPGLSAADVAAIDPVYSSDYSALTSPTDAGKSVYLAGDQGVAAGWYTLLPAKYALLPGGMRVVEDTRLGSATPGASHTLLDGTVVTTGYYGVAGTGFAQSTQRVFDVQSQAVINNESKIYITSGNSHFAALATHAVSTTPQLPIDAGRLILSPQTMLDLSGTFATQPATGGRGAVIDISGLMLAVEPASYTAPASGGPIVLTDTRLDSLGAASLLLGGVRVENADFTTTLDITSKSITVGAGASLTVPEIILATAGAGASLSVDPGASIVATGAIPGESAMGYVIDGAGGAGANGGFLRVSDGPYRPLSRINQGAAAAGAVSIAGTLTAAGVTDSAGVVSGGAITIDGLGAVSLDSATAITTPSLSLGAGQIAFGDAPAGSALLITAPLRQTLANIATLNLRSGGTLLFANGAYAFQTVSLDTPGLAESSAGGVTLTASGDLTLADSGAGLALCGTVGAMACGSDTLAVTANHIVFGSGALTTFGFGGGVTLSAAGGVFYDGAASFDAGAQSLKVITPFLGDRGTGKAGAALPSLSLAATSGATTTMTTSTVSSTPAIVGTDTVTTSSTTGAVTITTSVTTTVALAPHATYRTAVATTTTTETSGMISVSNGGVGAYPYAGAPAGTPGANLALSGASVSVQGTDLRATAGRLKITSVGTVSIDGGAGLETPAYLKTFGDPADPTAEWAPAGAINISAQAGDIAISPDSRLAIGYAGTIPNGVSAASAGSLTLTAQQGAVKLALADPNQDSTDIGSVITTGVLSGGSLNLDGGTGGFNLPAFLKTGAAGQGFTGSVSIRTGAGDLMVATGDTLKATGVTLVADGGVSTIAGTIDVSGVNGGNVDVYGLGGVSVAATGVIDAHANGYAASDPTDTRQASGGNVTLGTDGAGAVTVASGARIDVGARDPNARLVNLNRSNGAYYEYVAADTGGTITFRAPAPIAPLAESVNVTVDPNALVGASSVVLEGFHTWNLADFASGHGSKYIGVTIAGNQATLDLSQLTSASKVNPLTDTDSRGVIVPFVQGFVLSSDYLASSGFSTVANFHARPGIDLAFSGDIVLASNWNLGAGVVDQAGAIKAGLMVPNVDLAGQNRNIVVPGAEGQILANYTTAIYRVGGKFTGEPGVLTLRAGGNLDLQGSITDGFFQFRDQTDPNYLNLVLGGGQRTITGSLSTQCVSGACTVFLPPGGQGQLNEVDYVNPSAPYSARANSPAALGDLNPLSGALGGAGDPLGSAEVFPLLPVAAGQDPIVHSWSYQLVAGAAPSADPLTVAANSNKTFTVEGFHPYSYTMVQGATKLSSANVDIQDINGANLSPIDWYNSLLNSDAGLSAASSFTLDYSGGSRALRFTTLSLVNQFFAQSTYTSSQYTETSTSTTTSLAIAAALMQYISDNFGVRQPGLNTSLASFYSPAPEVLPPFGASTIFATAPSRVRTGDGGIAVAASGNIDLTNGPTTLVDVDTGQLNAGAPTAPYLGGAAIYTAGHLAVLASAASAVDAATGQTIDNIDLASGSSANQNIFATDPQGVYSGGTVNNAYDYGYGEPLFKIFGVMIANPAYLQGGGSVNLNAGLDVLGRRDTLLDFSLGGVGTIADRGNSTSYRWIGNASQPWRTGAIGGDAANGYVVDARIDPQLFQEGVGTLGGGDVTITAARNVSDLTMIVTDSLTTASLGSGGPQSAIVTLGGGNLVVTAGADLLGGRVDVASGHGALTAGGAVASAGTNFDNFQDVVDNTLRIRVSDATVDITARLGATLQGIAALGIGSETNNTSTNADNSLGFYSTSAGVSILADGPVTIDNVGVDVVSAQTLSTSNTLLSVYPGAFQAVSLTADLALGVPASDAVQRHAAQILLAPSPTGTLTLLADGDIANATIGMLDNDPTVLPGAFSNYSDNGVGLVTGGAPFVFPEVLSSTTDVERRNQHNASITHAGDAAPNRIAAGHNLNNLILSVPKATRVYAANDIVNMTFFGQNVAASDITRVAAGRDITSTSAPAAAESLTGEGGLLLGLPLPAVQGDTFILGGPGTLDVEAGRDAGPFLNSAVTNGLGQGVATSRVATGVLTYGNGIITVGNEWNPFLPAQGASILTEFGVGKGQNFAGLTSAYLDPAAFAGQAGYLFEQLTGAQGVKTPDRSKQIYALSLTDWLSEIAGDIVNNYDLAQGVSKPGANAPALVKYALGLSNGATTTTTEALTYLPLLSDQRMPLIPWLQLNQGAALTKTYGTVDVTYAQAYQAFNALPQLVQRQFLLKDVYFNELQQTSIPTSVSYLKYARGYTAVNTLYPASDGYTQNSLNGGGAPPVGGLVTTGNLDLRLAAIETSEGGDITIAGPGGRVLAGSTVRTDQQAALRNYVGGALYAGGNYTRPVTAAIVKIPVGYEGVITLNGGSIDSFTDGDFLLNQSRAFTVAGGDVTVWSSNADVNAGQGPRTTADVPPVVVRIDADGYSLENTTGKVSGAGIGAFAADANGLAPSVYLIAPNGKVDAGDAGVRSAGNVFIAALQVANADAIQAKGTISGVQGPATNVAAQASGDAAATAAEKAAMAAATAATPVERPLIYVDVLGFLAGESGS